MKSAGIAELLKKMTLAEKASLCSGLNNADTKPVERLNIPPLKMHDGPNGLRREDENVTDSNFGGYQSVPAVCYPSGCALACSWDVALMERLASLLAEECHAEQLPVLLGPAINIKRSPLCGRNFEYLSEDPYLAGKLAAAYIRILQQNGIGAGLKHFAANNQERRRQSVDAVIDERTLREIYLAGFEIAVTESKPWSVMCAYNRLNGSYCCENEWLLNKVLRDEWGFDGFVVSDWTAVNDRVKSLQAGLDLEMPYSGPENDQAIVRAVENGSLPMETLDRAVAHMLPAILQGAESMKESNPYDKAAHHQAARTMACECSVLLKNRGDLLPLAKGSPVAVLGALAMEARYQGGGAAHVLAAQVDCPFDEIRRYAPQAKWAAGYPAQAGQTDEALLAQAVSLAKESPYVIIFAGLTDEQESEAFDRPDMKISPGHSQLIRAVSQVNPNVVVVLMAGAPVEMDWEPDVRAILHANLGGEAVGGAIADMIFGISCPGGRLAESYPCRLEHNPSYLNFGMDAEVAEYREGVFVGYRYYTTTHTPVRYPFGFGLSYTGFAYTDLVLPLAELRDGDPVQVGMTLQNIGPCEGSEVVQLYVRGRSEKVIRPDRELKGFRKVRLAPGETQKVSFMLDSRAFAYFDVSAGSWRVESGAYDILIGASCEDIRLSGSIHITGRPAPLEQVNENTPVVDLLQNSGRKALLLDMLLIYAPKVYAHYVKPQQRTECASLKMIHEQYLNMPLRVIRLSAEGSLSMQTLQSYIDRMNQVTAE